MRVKSMLAIPFASVVKRGIEKWSREPVRTQEFWFHKLVQDGKKTGFGKDHGFNSIISYEDFKRQVPIRDYEGFRPYIDRIVAGEAHVLWKGFPIYFAKSSGTTSGVKYIPVTRDSVSNHIDTARNALLAYIAETGNNRFVDGKMIFLSGSPVLEKKGSILTGRLSGIVNHHVPRYLRGNQLPTFKTNCIEDWEEKVDRIVEETSMENMTLISGIPPWIQMYFEKLLEYTGKKTIREVFPGLQLLVYGGVNFEPYRNRLFKTIGDPVDSIETYPASEGFIAFQDSQKEEGLLLNLDSGIFFEFVPASEINSENPHRFALQEVETGVNYAILLTSNAGLWSYLIGDTVKFVSTHPYRILVTGRISQYISAFGEHVIAEEVEQSLQQSALQQQAEVVEFTVAPQVNPGEGILPFHEWLVEFARPPADLGAFAAMADELLRKKNIYYDDLITGHILQPLKVRLLPRDTFRNYMKSIGKLGGQNKVPRLHNDRLLAEAILALIPDDAAKTS